MSKLSWTFEESLLPGSVLQCRARAGQGQARFKRFKRFRGSQLLAGITKGDSSGCWDPHMKLLTGACARNTATTVHGGADMCAKKVTNRGETRSQRCTFLSPRLLTHWWPKNALGEPIEGSMIPEYRCTAYAVHVNETAPYHKGWEVKHQLSVSTVNMFAETLFACDGSE